MKIAYIINILIAICLLLAAMSWGGGIHLFFDIASFILTPVLPIIVILCTFRFSEILQAFGNVLKNRNENVSSIKTGILFFNTFQSYLIYAAALSFIIGMILILAHADEISQIGPPLAMALLTVFYSMTVILIVVAPFRAGLRKMLNDTGE